MDMCFFSLSTSTSTEVVSVLLDAQANPNVAMGDGETALMRASKIDGIGGTGGYGGPAVVPLLLNAGADPNAQTKDGTFALMGATASVIPILLAARAEPNSRDSAGATALIHGASNRRAASLLLAAGADPNAHTGSGTTALMCADGSVVPLLLAAAADPNARDHTGTTALSIAAHSCNTVVVSLLLSARSDPRSVLDGADLSAALLKAAREGNDAMTMALLAAGADPTASDGTSALAYAEKPLESTLSRASGTDWQTLKEDWLEANHGKSECVRLLKAAILKRRETLEVLVAVMLACARLAPMDTANAVCNPFAASLAALSSRPLEMIADAVAALGWDANFPH
jgi:ankyrin repeat protein